MLLLLSCPPPSPPLTSPHLQSQKYKKKQEKAEALQQREAQLEAGRAAIAGSLRITSALTLIDETVKMELKEGKNGAPVSGWSCWLLAWVLCVIRPAAPPLTSMAPPPQHLSEVELDALDQFYNLVDPASIREKAEE